MRDCFHDDSVVRISWINASGPEFVRRSKEMVEQNVQASHRLGPIFVTLAGDRAIAQLAAIIDIPFTLNGTEVVTSCHHRLLLRAERRESALRLSGFDAVYLRDEIAPVIPGQTVAVDPEAVKAFRPSYRLLSYTPKMSGTRMNSQPNHFQAAAPDRSRVYTTSYRCASGRPNWLMRSK